MPGVWSSFMYTILVASQNVSLWQDGAGWFPHVWQPMPEDTKALEMGDADFEFHSFRGRAVPSSSARWERPGDRALRESGTEESDMPLTYIQGFPIRGLIDAETQVPGEFLMKSIPFCLYDPLGYVRNSLDENINNVTLYQQGLKAATAWSFQKSDLEPTANHYVLVSNEVLDSDTQQFKLNWQLLPIEHDESDLDNKVLLIFMATHSSNSWGVKMQSNSTGRIKTIIEVGGLQPLRTSQDVVLLTITGTEGKAAKFLHGNLIFTNSQTLEETFLPIFLDSGKSYIANICGYDTEVRDFLQMIKEPFFVLVVSGSTCGENSRDQYLDDYVTGTKDSNWRKDRQPHRFSSRR
ncbi:hypothetical protein CYMTET_10503, partial [Cymbomonas tetramitiformis]